jgi:lipopolysaccharide/colanic/teichoic acid biosynthesis glycosyltransferase
MTAEHVSTVGDHGRSTPPPSQPSKMPHGHDLNGAAVPRWGHGAHRPHGSGPLARPSASRLQFDEAIPLNDFLAELHRETRRAERSGAALSLVLYRIDDAGAPEPPQADRLLEILHDAKRETDTLGHVGDDTIAVICPDTDEEGTKGFMRKIDARAGDARFATIAATYPDDLFDNLVRGMPAQPAFQPFLALDTVVRAHSGYPLKRWLDVAGAIVALLVFAPLMLLVAAAIALTSRGPVIFKQTRLGKGGTPFTFYKFRSMAVDVDDAIHRDFVASLIAGAEAPVDVSAGDPAPYKLQSDPRVTRIGRLIRKTSIDELPQFLNVLKGDMSLVGPRPPLPYEAAQYQPWHLRRLLTAKPGITGLWQVEGRSKVTFNEMVRMDLRYIRDCSLWLDVKIVLKTVLVVLRCDGAG